MKVVWATGDISSVWYPKEGGEGWSASTGISPQAQLVRHVLSRLDNRGAWGLCRSTDGGGT